MLTHEVYVWQRAWTSAVRAAVTETPPELTGLRVLALEVEPARAAAAGATELPARTVWPDIDPHALARSGRPVTAVVRVNGSRSIADLSLTRLWTRIGAWQAAGARVIGVEIDHDCATAGLAEYADWLGRWQAPAGLRRSITALPTWADAPALAQVAAAVDELVVQVHAVRAPEIFASRSARAWLEMFAASVGDRPLRVAVPTYSARVTGKLVSADAADVAGFVRSLERAPIAQVRGVVWFRLPVAGDRTTWSTATLRAVIADEPLTASIEAVLVERAPEIFDIALVNRGTSPGPWPDIHLQGEIQAVDLLHGYRPTGSRPGQYSAPSQTIEANATTVIGWARGRNIAVATH